MGFVLIIFGIAFLLAGYHGNAKALFTQLGGEFTGTPSFGKWAIAILVIGGVGYIKPIKPISDAFLLLVIVVLFLSDKGFFAQFSQQFGLTGNAEISGSTSLPALQPLSSYQQFINPSPGVFQNE